MLYTNNNVSINVEVCHQIYKYILEGFHSKKKEKGNEKGSVRDIKRKSNLFPTYILNNI